jgi:cytochrome P450 family 135
LLEGMRSLCTKVTVRLVLGVSDPDRSERLINAIRRMLNTPGNPPLPLPAGDDGPGGAAGWVGEAIFARRAAPVRALLLEELHDRRSTGRPGDDLLSVMLGSPRISDEAIVDELLIVLMAAQEPPAIALTNIICELASDHLWSRNGSGTTRARGRVSSRRFCGCIRPHPRCCAS